jgi:hypothetical protein
VGLLNLAPNVVNLNCATLSPCILHVFTLATFGSQAPAAVEIDQREVKTLRIPSNRHQPGGFFMSFKSFLLHEESQK